MKPWGFSKSVLSLSLNRLEGLAWRDREKRLLGNCLVVGLPPSPRAAPQKDPKELPATAWLVFGAWKPPFQMCLLWAQESFHFIMQQLSKRVTGRGRKTVIRAKMYWALRWRVKEESEKVGLNLNIQKTKIMASGPITSWQIDGVKVKQWQILFSWAPKSLWMVTAAMKLKDTCSSEEKLWQT